RVNVYIQSGAYKVLRMLNEHTNATEILNLVNNMKDSGLGVSLILLAGTGGKLYREDHVEGTANLVSQMLLDAGDTVYISPIVEEEDPSYGDSAARIGTSPLSNDEKYLQMAEIEKRIKTAYRDINGTDFPARIVKYDLRECIY
ncbi:radical SAM protein, partial [Thermoplasmatales archaeon AK]|nr:radical SAM protein [Thermoplasmatales archaeon AK]